MGDDPVITIITSSPALPVVEGGPPDVQTQVDAVKTEEERPPVYAHFKRSRCFCAVGGLLFVLSVLL